MIEGLVLIVIFLRITTVSAFLTHSPPPTKFLTPDVTTKLFVTANRKSSFVAEEAALKEAEERSGNITGAQFFGGTKQKEELFDPDAEKNAKVERITEAPTYVRWDDGDAFKDDLSRSVARSLQGQMNGLLYAEEETPKEPEFVYGSSLQWQSPFSQKHPTPFQELEEGLNFYRRIDLAITAGKSISETEVELRWEISVAWPNFWESRVLLTGSSLVTVNLNKEIIKQVDVPDDENFSGTIRSQVTPRFWDNYHFGMAPSAELSPLLSRKKIGDLFKSYSISTMPPRLVYQPELFDLEEREDGNAAFVPSHAFCEYIKTVGPFRQRYVTTSPVEVQIMRSSKSKKPRLKYLLPLSVELQTNPTLPLPGEDPLTSPEAEATAEYTWQAARTVATVPFGGTPQDNRVADLRKKLYDAVVKDGLQPKLDSEGRPVFFFLSYDTKACYTSETGLGMCVYEYRAQFMKGNRVGIELESEPSTLE